MPNIVADMVDAYIIRRINARVQYLLLLRRPDLDLGNTWQSIHSKILAHETAHIAAKRAIGEATGLAPLEAYSADYTTTFYDHRTDALIFAPVLAFVVAPRSTITLSDDYRDSAWCEREEATARLLWSSQRWAVRHIDEVIGHGGPDAEFYKLD